MATSPAAAPAACKSERDDFHPLEVFPVFRRYRPGIVRDIAYTFLWNAGLGFLFWLIAIVVSPRHNLNAEYFVWNQIMAQAIGYTLHALFEIGGLLRVDAWMRGKGWGATAFYYAGVSTVGVVLGFGLVSAMIEPSLFYNWLRSPRMLATMAVSSVLISTVLSAVLFLRERRARAEAELERGRLRSERIEREAVLANLRALQAQIEPHFLFNTLANVTSLIDADAPAAKRMLESFIRFLRASLGATRTESTTLGAEAELIAAYLEVLKVRMGGRLRFSVDIPGELDAFTLPPMLLQPVVENAIRHGLEPKVEGGEVRLAARRGASVVEIEIRDTGVGFASITRGGVGLSNLRERLRLLYADSASLSVSDAPGGGAIVRVSLPA